MADVFVTLFVVGFFGLCVAYVRACDRIVGPDSDRPVDEGAGAGDAEPAR